MQYRGVYQEGSAWLARIHVEGKQRRIGRFPSAEEAARAYDREALRIHGEDADLNFPEDVMSDRRPHFKTEWLPTPKGWEHFKHHPLACKVRYGAGIDMDRLAAHMRSNGYDHDEAITLYREDPRDEWLILDGRHRVQAAIMAGITPTFRHLVSGNPVEFVAKKALRQHLSEDERAVFAAGMTTAGRGRQPKNDSSNGAAAPLLDKPVTNAQAAKLLNVPLDAVKDAKKIAEKGTPELQQAFHDGTISRTDAAAVAGEAPEVQQEAVEEVRKKKQKTASNAVKKKKEEVVPGTKDDAGTKVPERLRGTFAAGETFKKGIAACKRAAQLLKDCEQTTAYLNAEEDRDAKTDRKVYSTMCQTAAKKLESRRPALVCSECGGAEEPSPDSEPCEICGGKGYLMSEEVEAPSK